jgi:hypothetical protein
MDLYLILQALVENQLDAYEALALSDPDLLQIGDPIGEIGAGSGDEGFVISAYGTCEIGGDVVRSLQWIGILDNFATEGHASIHGVIHLSQVALMALAQRPISLVLELKGPVHQNSQCILSHYVSWTGHGVSFSNHSLAYHAPTRRELWVFSSVLFPCAGICRYI